MTALVPFRLIHRSLKSRSAKSSSASNDSSSHNNNTDLLERWDQYQQRVQKLIMLEPALAQPIVDGLGRVLNLIDLNGVTHHGTKA
jgi:hypothetical protein